ncbi:MAG: hypothetical protein CVV41_07325 [Candidatus Riflebacteria bacterium HGW-Riflebacteria-1]|jgi:hypothetical protein|nr:MAG: hypothetical protein CVV41_07325 [Candidatus Riflebacteria bacterium HGW-Riflebacteria-1]
MAETASRSIFEKLIYLGIATFFLWPFVQLWSIKAIPVFDSDTHLRASVALENLIEEAISRPYERNVPRPAFKPVKGCEDIGLYGRVEAFPHPEMPANVMLRATVRWGIFPLGKSLSLEYLRARTRP